jgi:uncharacterized protein (TIGR02171 family)
MRSLILLFTFLFISCALDDGKLSGNLYEYDAERTGMVRIPAKDQFVLLGTNDSTAPLNDRPSMKVKFTYSFSISKNEVTRKEYIELMGGKSSSVQDSGDLPQTNVTYYDAILFANAKSVNEGYDTAYTYSSALFDSEGNCTYLEGLLFDPLTEAYRLPTEAEWVFVASHNWKPSQGWNNLNSDYRAHEVCTADTNKLSICDMAGNVMEWVNDWLGHLMDTTVTNYVGAPDGGSLGQRVVKGGSFNNALGNITLYSRGDVYTVTSSTKSDYVGFRLAFGVIPSPTWINDAGLSLSRISILASSSQVKSITGTYQTKLAFVNYETGNLAYIDYSNSTLTVTEIVDTLPAFHPEISPDGKRVAFCTKPEGVSGSSEVYVRDLNPSGSNLVRLNVESASIPRFRVLPSGDTVIVYVSDAGNNKDDAEWKQKTTWQVPFKNGQFGTPEKFFDGSYHGGFSEDGSLAVTGARLLHANLNGKDSVWYNGEQACNASLSKDSTKRTMFLDFGGQTGADFVGSSYGTHERLLIADSTGTLIQSIAAPENFAFDHSEWSNIKNIAVSSVTNRNGAHSALYLISTEDSSLLKVVEGNELWHPSLWVNSKTVALNTSLSSDSLGVYLVSNATDVQSIFRVKMELFWKMKDDVEIIALGSSRTEKGIDPLYFKDYNVINMATPGILDQKTINYFAKNYAINHAKKLKYIVFALDLDGWIYNGIGVSHIFQELPGYIYDANHDFWKEEQPESIVEAIENSLAPPAVFFDLYTRNRGACFEPSENWREFPPLIAYDTLWAEEQPELIEQGKEYVLDLIKETENHGIKLIGIIFPQSPHYKKTGTFGRYGMSRSQAEKIIAWLNQVQKEYNHFILMDENKMGNHDYTDEMAFDYDHLSVIGATQLSSRLDSLLHTLE